MWFTKKEEPLVDPIAEHRIPLCSDKDGDMIHAFDKVWIWKGEWVYGLAIAQDLNNPNHLMVLVNGICRKESKKNLKLSLWEFQKAISAIRAAEALKAEAITLQSRAEEISMESRKLHEKYKI